MKTPLHLACRKADLGMVQLLLESEEVDPSPQDAQGFTPLHYRQTLENADITDCLIQKGAAVDIPSKVYTVVTCTCHCIYHILCNFASFLSE